MTDLCKVLLVHDNPKSVKDVLPYYGYDVVCAADGRSALQILDNDNSIDIVLLDVMMPEMDGWETLNTKKSFNGKYTGDYGNCC